ncbi:Fanconi anemia group C protein isoform X1 [Chiroxiphia lanceolata]|uniref:Fanconi anemia group C protein isoform X1 n=1 Tax=Chiroxiphia lanceolata TaxID=296741 RepID=UPI0013CEFB69|nr:Fanconi anemia group C protein isoform X1 [Chiroxiphia lanceolata]XP_032530535.1 Fanconi anemia group C protein isoform X1 [Chiroxiphia lanceolata]XP_032530536.1 Fanconi anemia group C protein isoform X1 [Chiroxiphia lanceolata]XP_032530537.1 Fanconi anemia group C protein isoform X1 [Chiroxiphia lanceolata]XP_032530538.1 Fanconi anemia group C protein isoform X1 [Chiroxiphia lanceolata]XP_032530539.1 Fanconi anemia group C protein isoform X1 [Chiroxiphia lanceolata]XP_032530540.1 Fanconi 
MAQDTTVPKLNFEYWLDKAVEWGQATTLESQKDVCLHLPQLQEFLHQLYETLKDVQGSVAAIQQFPLIGQLLGRLCWNPFVIGYDESQEALMWCLCCLYSSEPQNPVEMKANSWIRSLLCHLLSSSEWESNEAETNLFISTLGYTSADYYGHLVKNMIFSLVTELRENPFNGLNIQRSVSASRVNAVSICCVPLITLPDLTPLLETLLLYHGGSPKEILCPEFLEAVNEAFLKKKISLPDSAVCSLWLRHSPSLEKATLHLLDQLVSIQLNSLEEVACVIKDSLLPQAASHPAIFRVVNEIFKNALLETDGASEVMTIIQVFTQLFLEARQNQNEQLKFPLKAYFPCHHQPLVRALLRRPSELPTASWSQHLKNISDMLKALVEDINVSSLTDLFETWYLVACFGEWLDIAAEKLLKAAVQPDALLWLLAFYYCPQNENQQRTQAMVEVQAVYNHLMMLFSCTDLSLRDLEAAVHRIVGTGQCWNQPLMTHLLTNFLLFSSGGHLVAQECIYHITETTDTSKEVYSLLTRTAYRFKHHGEGNQRTVKLLNELLQKLTLKV